MKRKNTTRNALFTSIISLLLCVSMLVGTTFAWFTDSVASGVNTIAAGNLDVELYHGKDANPVDKVDQNTLLFTDVGGNVIDLWEPGVVAFTNLKVANVGTLALKYQLSINSTEMNTVKDTELTLADALKVAVVEGGVSGTREQVIGAVADNAWTKLESFTLPGVLEADKKSETYGIVVYWQPGDNAVDNQFNMNNGKTTSNGEPLTITLGVNLFATQEMYEDDSFGPDYDEDAWVDGFDVYTEQDLNAAIANGETAIDLMGDIAVGEQILIPEGAKVKLNLNGKTLSSATGTVIRNEGALTLVGKGTVESAGQAYAIRVQQGTMIIDSADINVKGAFGAVSIFNGADVTINGGNFNAEGINGMTSHTVYVSKSTLTVNGGTFDSGYSSEGIDTICGSNSTITLNDGTFYASELGESFFLKNVTSVKGGTYQYKPANIAAGYKAVESNGKYIVVSENAIVTSDELVAAINTAADGDTLLLAPGEYSLRFTNNTAFNVDNLNIKGMDNAKLTVSSSEAWYGRVQGDNVTFENIHFTSSVGATGKATYNNCTFDDWTICASSGNKETYFNNCDINGTLNTSTDFSSGNTYVTDSTVAKAEFSGAATMYFTNCQIGELISWDMATVLKNCVVEKQDLKMVDQKVTTIETDENGLSLATNNADPDALVLYEVPSDYAADTLVIPEGVTSIGNYAFSNNTNVKTVVLPSSVTDLGRGFDTSTVKKVVLNEGLETISSRAFRSTPSLEEVVIPSTVTVIEDNAFQKSSIKEIVIPANVETIGEAAFASSKIEKVTFKGNTSIQGYAFRGCPNLREVHLEGNDVTFIASTLNGRNSMWFCNGESNNPNTSNITFNVVNETVATRVKTAMGAEAGNTPVYINGKLFNYTNVKNDNQLKDALANAAEGDVVALSAGKYTFPTSSIKEGVTLNCAPGTVFEGTSKLNINGATVVGATFSNPGGAAADQTINGTFKNCTFTGANGLRWCQAGETVVFENCVFSGDTYGAHFDGGANDVVFKNCTFSGFNAMGGEITKLIMEGCTFKANGKSNYNGINLWGNTEMKDCTFVFDGSAGYEWVDLSNSNLTVTFTNCVVSNGKTMAETVGNYGDNNTIIIDGITANIPNMN